MKDLPVPDPGRPEPRSAAGYLGWLARRQLPTLAGGAFFGITWMIAPALMPAAIGRAVDAIAAGDRAGLATSAAALVALGVLQTVSGVLRHRFAVTNWLTAAYRTVQVTVAQATRLGATLPRRVAAGEVVSVGTSDVHQIGNAADISARGAGAAVALVVVTVLLLTMSVPLGLLVVVGVPVTSVCVALLLRPLHQRSQTYRDLTGGLTNQAGDIVAGLRVLRGVGGEAAFAGRYRAGSQRVRHAGIRVAQVDSLLRAAQVLLPGGLVALVTWMAARSALAGTITPGTLVAFYGYANFLMLPIRTLTEFADKTTRALVAAGRVTAVLSLRPDVTDPPDPVPAPDADGAELHDPDSGVRIRPGRLTAVAATDPADAAALADRLGHFDPAGRATLAGVALRDLPVAAVRQRIVLADNDARLFNGPLRDELGGAPDRLAAALHTAAAEDILDALPDGTDTAVEERGREFSGGQQQRLRLVRALQADPPVLVLVEPTSAVDAHTEARIADRLARHRAGRTTVVCTTSPLVLDRADHVVYLDHGRVVAEGRHRDLLTRSPAYRSTVTREED